MLNESQTQNAACYVIHLYEMSSLGESAGTEPAGEDLPRTEGRGTECDC